MLGKPKYNYSDIVTFRYGDEKKEGVIAIVDAYGTFMDSSDVSYDIMITAENTLYKHVRETYVIEKTGQGESPFGSPF